jgi:hypothetical protein
LATLVLITAWAIKKIRKKSERPHVS